MQPHYIRKTVHNLIAKLAILAAFAVLAPSLQADDETVTVESLLHRMTDTRWLAVPPAAGERTVQFSSYDRASRIENGKMVHPFANGDRGQYLRVEETGGQKQWILAEAEGPGYVSRIWSANPDGELRIYIDGSSTPVLAAPFAAVTNGEVPPFRGPFGHDASRGRNLYFPFPFAKSIKISTTKGDQYFQVSVTTLPPGTKVESYSPEVLKRALPVMDQTRLELTNPLPRQSRTQTRRDFRFTAAAGVTVEFEPGILPADRAGSLESLAIRVDAPDREDALAHTLLLITFDGAREPQVALPLGEFFGSGPGVNPFQSAIHTVQSDGTMIARWHMPYRKSVQISLKNQSKSTASYTGTVVYDDAEPPANALYFHARWRYEEGLQTRKADGTMDWPALRATGAPGRFVGLLLNVFNPTPAWWGEGDEKIYVDGETFPSTFGTGTEDFFGYAWGDNRRYMNPFHAQSRCDGPGAKGNTSNIRYQILDSVPFHQSLGFDIEVWHWEAVKIQFATAAFFYAGSGAEVEPGIPDLSDRKVHAKPPLKREPNAIEAEDLKVRSVTAGEVPGQDMLPFGDAWSGGRQLWWLPQAPGARLDLELPVKTAGTFALSAAFTRAGDYGTVQFSLDGKALGRPIDLYEPAPAVIHSGDVVLGTVTLTPGVHTLSMQVTGKNERSTNYLVGMDWLKLTPAATPGP